MASSSTRLALALFLPSIMLSLLLLSPSHADTAVMCNPNLYADSDPFGPNKEDLLQAMPWLMTWAPSNVHDVWSRRPYQGTTLVYGHAVCRPSLIGSDCQQCLSYAATVMEQTCGHSFGGRAAQGDDCRVRYEQYNFSDD